MKPLQYHSGQRQIQAQANTIHIADRLSHWVGPAQEFALLADQFILAALSLEGDIIFSALSGGPPLVEVTREPGFSVVFPAQVSTHITPDTLVGGLAINLSKSRRVRINGMAVLHPRGLQLVGDELFTLCRKYMSPSIALQNSFWVGPSAREELPPEDTLVSALLTQAETSFLASMSPEGMLDVAHRGGLPGFIKHDAHSKTLSWKEYIGDGVFKSAGNIRSTGIFALLVPDPASGDAIEFHGTAEYTNLRTDRRQHLGPLIQDQEPFPVQGEMLCAVEKIFLLRKFHHPRQRIAKSLRITSLSTPHEQAPQ